MKNTVAVIRYFSGWADKIHGKTIETTENKMAYTRQEPFGVVVSLLFIHSHLKLSAYNVLGLHLALEFPSCISLLFSSWTAPERHYRSWCRGNWVPRLRLAILSFSSPPK